MVSDLDDLLRQAYPFGKILVVQQGTNWQTLSDAAIMSGGTFEKDFWTKVLDQNNLESPGYHEAVRDAIEASKAKKKAKLDGTSQNQKKKKKR